MELYFNTSEILKFNISARHLLLLLRHSPSASPAMYFQRLPRALPRCCTRQQLVLLADGNVAVKAAVAVCPKEPVEATAAMHADCRLGES